MAKRDPVKDIAPNALVTRYMEPGDQTPVERPSALMMMIVNEWLKDFDIERVSQTFKTNMESIRQALAMPVAREYLEKRLAPIEDLTDAYSTRLMEEIMKDAIGATDWKERTENRKIAARTLLGDKKSVSHQHYFHIEVPAKSESASDWAAQFKPKDPNEIRVIDAPDEE